MSFFFAYLIKFSISLAAVYLFYRFVLRRITFYNWNRWYLLGYTLLSFFIAAINITPLLQENQLADNKTILWVPALDLYGQGGTISNTAVAASHSLSASDWILFIIAAGTIILLVRLFIQYLSFLRIRSKAQLLSGDGMRIYQVNRDIIPFSFGNSIFINQELHTEEELQKIIRHEFVHVKQRHSIDILWGEFLCIINWFNPFAWLLRNSIRQNLEFIADNKVVSNGIDRKQYQYLLLKVIGNNHFSIASKFNFSSLKKRIAMMNKLRSAKVHLLKFLFLLPVAVVMLLAFRNKDERRSTNAKNVLQDTVPVNNVKLPDAIRSLSVKQVSTAPASKIAGGQVVVTRKDGKTEIYDLDDNKSLSSFEKKYGVSLEEIIPPPPPSPAEPTEMVAPQRTINSKGYLIDIVGFDGTCTVLVIDKSGKEVEQVTLDEWDADSKYEEKYGEILPPPPPVFALAPAAPTVPVEAVTGTLYSCGSHHYNCVHTSYNCKPTGSTTTPAPVALVVGEGYGISSTISRDYEITDKKATLKLLDGTIEEYDLTDKKAKVAFEKKYGKIIHINTNVNANIATSVSGNVNVNSVITIPAPKASVNGHLTTATVAPAAISHGGVTSVGSLSPTPGGLATTVRDPYSHVITGNEDIMIVISNKTTRQELENYKKQMNAKGIELSYDGIEYNDKGLLVSISGTMKGKDGQSNFVANDFDKLVLAMIKKGDKTWFKVSVKEKEVI